MKKFITAFLALILALSLILCGCAPSDKNDSSDTNQTPPTEDVESPDPTDSQRTNDESPVILLNKELAKDYEGKDVLVLTFEWTNLTDENTYFLLDVNVKCFQDGVALESAIMLDDTYPTTKDITEVKPGGTIEVAEAFILSNMESVVEIEVSPLFTLNDEELYMYDTYEF